MDFLLCALSDHNDSSTDTTATLPRLTMTSHPLALIISVAVGAAFGFLLITLPVNCFLVRACPGYKWCHSGSKSKGSLITSLHFYESAAVSFESLLNSEMLLDIYWLHLD